MKGLTPEAKALGICHIVTLAVGDEWEKRIDGNYFVFSRLV
jgi:hypothetical protein